MPNPVGRISGPLLRSNLQRTDDLAFETDLLYINHSGSRIGVKTDSPTRTLQVNGTLNLSNNIIATSSAVFGDMTFNSTGISALSGVISITSAGTIEAPNLRVGDIFFDGNVLGTYTTDSDLQLEANGTGSVMFNSSVEVTGNIHATGDITADGNIVIGTGDEDNLSFGADLASDILPNVSATPLTAAVITSGSCPETWAVPRTLSVIGTLNGKNRYNYFNEYLEWTGTFWKYWNTTVGSAAYYRSDDVTTFPWQATTWTAVGGLGTPVPIFSQQSSTGFNIGGSPSKRWANYEGKQGDVANNILVDDNVSLAGITVNLGIENKFYVSVNGVDTNPGDHPNFAFATLSTALSAAQTAGGNNLIMIMPGEYTETFPLTIPANTTVKGQSLRSVKIQPTVSTNDKDAFLLNDGCLISDLTVANFHYDSVGNTGYAFRFANNINVTAKSPYIQNITVIAKEFNYSLANGDWTSTFYREPDMNQIVLGTFAALPSFYNVIDTTTTGTVFSVVYTDDTTDILTQSGSSSYFGSTLNIPVTGFSGLSNKMIKEISWGNAGKGALVDGSVVNAASNQASMLFNAVTFITPGVDAVTMTNGVRVEFIDSFTYFANRSLYATNGSLGFANLGVKFGAEVRVIASASVYGNYGAVADGNQTLMYLINHNMAYVGSGKDVTNDRSLVVQAQEIVELNSGRIYYQSQDQSGNFRVSDTFVVDFDTGFVNLSPGSFAFTGSSLTVGLPGSQTYIDAERITLPNLTVSGNTIKSDINQMDIASASGTINFLTNTDISNNLTVSGNFTVGGSLINLGNQVTDTIDFEMEFISDIIPSVDNVYNLGSHSKNWDNVYTREFVVGDITISDNYMVANQSNIDLVIQANGTGRVVVDNLRFKTLVDSTSGNINIANSSRTTNFTGKAIQLPTGNAAQRPNVNADLRYNSVTGQFEGYNGAALILGGVKDLDQDTRIELNSDQFYFYANGVNTGRIDTAGNLIVNRFHSQSQFALNDNTVTVGSATPGTVAGMTANGTGVVQFDTSNYVFNNGTIRNTVTNSDILFQMTGVQKEQKVEFRANNKAVRVPFGNTLQRNPGVIGEIYYNTQAQRLQVYSGSVWAEAAGATLVTVTTEVAQELDVIYNLILA
jgi:hypothetical protein